jgi:NADH-quinone oxidoreductase subunit C
MPASGAVPAKDVKASAHTAKTTEKPADTGGGKPADKTATNQARKPRAKKTESEVSKAGSKRSPKGGGAA